MATVFWIIMLVMLIYLCFDGYRSRTLEFWTVLTFLALLCVGVAAIGKPAI